MWFGKKFSYAILNNPRRVKHSAHVNGYVKKEICIGYEVYTVNLILKREMDWILNLKRMWDKKLFQQCLEILYWSPFLMKIFDVIIHETIVYRPEHKNPLEKNYKTLFWRKILILIFTKFFTALRATVSLPPKITLRSKSTSLMWTKLPAGKHFYFSLNVKLIYTTTKKLLSAEVKNSQVILIV